jgi:hypothetical protein
MTVKSSGKFADILIIQEMRGGFPDVPFFADVDIAELTKGDDDALFLTIPIGKANVTSENKRFYDEAWLQELERQVIANRPIGIMGHLSDDEMSTKFPDEAVFWVGVQRVGELLWGKGYIPKASAARDRIRRYKSANKALATSIFATAEGIWNAARGAMDMLAETLKLQQIDIVPADRAGIPALAAIPMLTAEMNAAQSVQQGEIEMSKADVIKELSNAVVPPIAGWQGAQAQPEAQPVAEDSSTQAIREMLGVDGNVDLVKLFREMHEQTQTLTAISTRISECVATGVKFEAARPVVTELVKARNPQTVESVAGICQQVLDTPAVKEMLAGLLAGAAGPAAVVNGRVLESNGVKPVEDTAENRAQALNTMGINI